MLLTWVLALVVLLPGAAAWPQPPPRDGVATLVTRLEQAAGAADRAAIMALADRASRPVGMPELAALLTTPAPDRVVIRERDRSPLDARGQRLILEVFSERDNEGQLVTWRVDVQPDGTDPDRWGITDVTRLSLVGGLYRLSVNSAKEYDIHDLTVRAPDVELTIASGRAFVAETPDGPTAIILMGRGRMHFAPPLLAERTQLRIFAGHEALTTDFDVAFIRVQPSDYASVFDGASLQSRAVAPDDLRRATGVFDDYVGRSLQVDLSDLSRDRWSLPPSTGDFIAEIRTRRFGTLTYARSGHDAEDVSLFDRKRGKNISVYASADKTSQRGPYFSDDDLVDYDVLAYDIDAEITPDRGTLTGNARIKVKIRTAGTSSLTFRLAQSLVVRGVYSPEFGRLLHLRIVGQSSLIVNLPAVVTRGMELWLDVVYGGRLAAQSFDGEAMAVGQEIDDTHMPMEPRFLYSNRSYWYPQSTVTDYAVANLRITVPAEYDVVATGDPAGPPAPAADVADAGRRPRATFVFDVARPARYLACVISRLVAVDSALVPIEAAQSGASSAGGTGPSARLSNDISLYVRSHPRQAARGRELVRDAASILQFYASLTGGAPYPSFTLALIEGDRPGGHSPPYFAVLNQVVGAGPLRWRNDPVSFDSYASFFLAHELAHQWWGHAVGWKNYHEQWISEGFSQYFAVLYAEQSRPGGVLGSLLRQMRETAMAASTNGPVYLGYRLGHIKGDDRVFRAVVYNKGAMVLHMLRRLLGDRTFFAGVRGFYEHWKFQKAGTDDFRQAMENVSGRDLRRFFDTWIYGSAIPRVKFRFTVSGQEAVLRFEQLGEPVDLPITVAIAYSNGQSEESVVALAERVTEHIVALKGTVRSIVANADNSALVEIEK